MRPRLDAATLLAFALAAAPAAAQTATVQAVQYPAWLDRGGATVPLAPGTRLQPKDRLRTGANARVRLQLAEGSAVKLGERAEFVIARAEPRGVFSAALEVLRGAFRFTTAAIARAGRRDVTIKVKHVTVGIRGTDLWGKSTAERDFVVLLEGRITVGSEGFAEQALTTPLERYEKRAGAAPERLMTEAAVVQEFAKETEPSADGAGAVPDGKWRVEIPVAEGRDAALAVNRALRGAGYPSEVATAQGRTFVQVLGLAGEPQARALAAALRPLAGGAEPGVRGP